MRKNCSRLLVTLVLLSVISITAQVAHAQSSLGDDIILSGGAPSGASQKPGVGQSSSEPDSPSKAPSVPVLHAIGESREASPSVATLRWFERVQWISRIWAALYLRVIK